MSSENYIEIILDRDDEIAQFQIAEFLDSVAAGDVKYPDGTPATLQNGTLYLTAESPRVTFKKNKERHFKLLDADGNEIENVIYAAKMGKKS